MTLSEIPMNTSGTGGGSTGADDGGQHKRLPFVRSNVDEVMGWAGGIWGRVGGGMPQWALQSSVQSYVSKIPRRDEFGVKWDKDDDDDDEGNRKRGREVAADLARTDSDSEEQTSSDYDESSSSESEDEDEGPFVDPSKAVQRANQRQSIVNAKAKTLKSARCTSAKPASSQQQPAAAARTSGRSSSSSAASASAISASNSASAKAIASALRNPAVNISYDGAIRPFPESVHAMVTETAAEDPTLIAWVKDGEAFAVKDTGPRLAPVLQKFFRHTKYSSLQRQLNIYGWTKCTDGRYKGAFYNPEFHRDLAIANLEGIVRRPPPSRQRGSSRSSKPSSRAGSKGDDKRDGKKDSKTKDRSTAAAKGGKGINSSKKLEQLAAARAAKKAKKRKRSSF